MDDDLAERLARIDNRLDALHESIAAAVQRLDSAEPGKRLHESLTRPLPVIALLIVVMSLLAHWRLADPEFVKSLASIWTDVNIDVGLE